MKNIAEKILEMEKVCFDKPWSFVTLSLMETNPAAIIIVEDYGYALGLKLSGDCELHRIAVLPEYRGQGKGYSLMQRFLGECTGTVFLEVASRNVHAIRLYEKCGFVEINRRNDYYRDDDAIVMKLERKHD